MAPRTTTLVHAPASMQALMLAARAAGQTIGFVPTMGALHAGHAALLDEARRRADVVVLSVFVNPTQFGQAEDLAKYPRTLEADVEIARRCGVDIVFAPSADDMYPPGFDSKLVAGQLAKELEGADRAGHFDGVLTVVNLLFQIVQPHFAVFGEKDYQQLQVVRRMTQDLRLPVEIVPMPVIREVDGLAMSSRNVRLNAADRVAARALSKALVAGQDALQRGEREARVIQAAARAALVSHAPDATINYIEVRDARHLLPVARVETTARLLLAATIGGVRLIDNGPLFPGVSWNG
jgi:pantoate--beta-alanine ligase